MVHLQSLYEKYRSKGVVILGFNSSDDKKIALEMLKANSVTFPNILDTSDAARKTAFQDYRSSGVPLNYIIDGQGKIAAAWYGYEKDYAQARAALRKLGIEIGGETSATAKRTAEP